MMQCPRLPVVAPIHMQQLTTRYPLAQPEPRGGSPRSQVLSSPKSGLLSSTLLPTNNDRRKLDRSVRIWFESKRWKQAALGTLFGGACLPSVKVQPTTIICLLWPFHKTGQSAGLRWRARAVRSSPVRRQPRVEIQILRRGRDAFALSAPTSNVPVTGMRAVDMLAVAACGYGEVTSQPD